MNLTSRSGRWTLWLLFAAVAATSLSTTARSDDTDKKAAPSKADKKAPRRLWGRKAGESPEKYAERRRSMIKRCKKDTLGMFSIKNLIFLVRTDITPDFTVDLALYMEELHRAYQAAFVKLGAPASRARDLVEVVCYGARERYIAEGGNENSGGHFHPAANFDPKYWNRPPGWPAGQFRLSLFTSGVTDFDKWDKRVMKHEAAHMELQLRLGYSALDAPRWWNEGMAACFEYWDFDKDTDANFAEIPNRGRYAPFIRKLWGTPHWKDFEYVWTIDGAAWHRDMSSGQGYLNYCQAWSLAAFMFNQGVKGKKFFNQIFNLSISLGADRANRIGVRTRGWEEAFPSSDRAELEEAWVAWVKKNLPKNKRNKGEEMELLKQGFDPKADKLVAMDEETLRERLAEYGKGGPAKPKRKRQATARSGGADGD